jgi:tetratricopeptide (TPR) repeat protein
MTTLSLKRLGASSLDEALEKAKQYRALNQPDEAVSICKDVLDVSPDHPAALRILGLALTDEFHTSWVALFDEAVAVFAKLKSEYERVYYTGVAWERCGKAQLEHGQIQNAVLSLEHAIDHFERSEKLAPPSSPDPVLRYNRCVRLLTEHPRLAEARVSGHGWHEFQHGD